MSRVDWVVKTGEDRYPERGIGKWNGFLAPRRDWRLRWLSMAFGREGLILCPRVTLPGTLDEPKNLSENSQA